MRHKLICFSLFIALLFPATVFAAAKRTDIPDYLQSEIKPEEKTEFERGSVVYLRKEQEAFYKGKKVKARATQREDNGLVLHDGEGGIIIIPGSDAVARSSHVIDARELKLQLRELASQLVAGLPSSLASSIALPTAFVQQDDFDRSSSFGRFIVEQLYYEFNQRGLRTKEYRISQALTVREDGEFILSRNINSSALDANTIYVVGTYYTDGNVLFLNARLIRANGDILRTGQLIIQVSPLTKRMLANSGRKIQEGSLEIKDFNTEARQPDTVTAFDQGLDIH